MKKLITAAAIAAMGLTATAALAAPTTADKCEASKNKAVGAYYSCREKAEASAILKALPADYSKCDATFDGKWDGAETKGEGMCPDTVTLTADMSAFLAAQAADAALVVAGAPIPDCAGDIATCEGELSTCDGNLATCDGNLTTCDGDLATCDSDLTACDGDLANCEAQPVGQEHETGQTICYDTAGTMIACVGTGQDGEFQKGVANSFTDNGDGTVTDNLTGLMWEKLSDDGSIHDRDTTYNWTDAVTTKMAALNSAVFAGHNDWRMPNRNELLSLVNIGAVNPATFAAFNTACVPGCTVLTCSCIQSFGYSSSSTFQSSPASAWFVSFGSGGTGAGNKAGIEYVRAVRAGS